MTTVVNCTLDELEHKVLLWGYEKGILPNGQASKQFSKTLEEVSELCSAIESLDDEEVIDAIGDIVVTLIMQANIWGVDLKACLGSAYDVIAKRTGTMVNGVFVKD
jgi:NTP pyrophosphatase (non-canonical NTP hydrolase)